ncbi:redoxin domain-containing protein [Salipaludibacillus sp. CF4.18]|uniref:redoxin domain-containing protein n=1 Tax=Salipaludibacillus sp. CF4.18 TaxID=3373081 RepID=UPI003EE7157D
MSKRNKIILALLVVGMVGWAVIDLVMSTSEGANQEDNVIVTETPSADDEEVVASDSVGLGKGEIAPDFELTTLKGEKVRLSDYRGKRVFVNFWATWCPPCRAEMPDMEKLYGKTNIEILAVNLTESEKSEENVATFVDEFGLTFPVLMDEESELESTYQVQAYPTSYLIDSNGRIQYIALGAMNYDLMFQEFEKME